MDISKEKLSVGTLVLVASGIGLTAYIASLIGMAKRLIVAPSYRIHNVSWQGITFGADVRITNPTNNTVDIRQPFVAVLPTKSSRSPIATSEPSSQFVQIKKQATTQMPPVLIHVPWLRLASMISRALQNGEAKITLFIRVGSAVRVSPVLPAFPVNIVKEFSFVVPVEAVQDILLVKENVKNYERLMESKRSKIEMELAEATPNEAPKNDLMSEMTTCEPKAMGFNYV